MFRLAVTVVLGLAMACSNPGPSIVLATTTSVANSGALDLLVPPFERETGLRVRSLPVGSGRALRLLAAGTADVVISHAPAQESGALRQHPDWSYTKILFNDFLIAGPATDPAGVAGARDALEAFRRIGRGRVRFVSRADQSGTHEREQALWTEAGVSPDADHLISTGQGMAATLRIAGEMEGYTLSDRGTFEQLAPQVRLKPLYWGDARLLNSYAVIAPRSHAGARRFASWLADGAGRELVRRAIASGRLRGFQLWPAGAARADPGDLPPRR